MKDNIIWLLNHLRQTRFAVGRTLLAITIVFNTIGVMPSYALFDDLGAGARAPGMGNAFVGLADDANAIHYNPAGLAQIQNGEITSMYGQFLNGLDDGSNLSTTYLGYATPLRRGQLGTLGMAYHNFKVSNLLSERTLYLAYGWNTRIKLFNTDGRLALGATLKQLHHEFEPDRFTENALGDVGTATGQSDPLLGGGASNDAYALDIGSLYRFGRQERFSAGLAIRNINRPDISLSGSGDKAPLSLKLGLAYRPRWGAITTELRRISTLSSVTDTEAAIGLERTISLGEVGGLTLRGGYAEGSRNFKSVNAGMSYQFNRAQLDYAFNFPFGSTDDTEGSHRMGFSFKVGSDGPAFRRDQRENRYDLLSEFRNDAKTSYVLLTRAKRNYGLKTDQRALLLQLLMKNHAGNTQGLLDIRADLVTLLSTKKYQMLDWPTLKAALVQNFSEQEKLNLGDVLEKMAVRDNSFALARLALSNPATRKDTVVKTISAFGHGELAAQSYRARNIDQTIDHVRQLLELMPNDEIITVAYRQLLLMRSQNVPIQKPAPVPEPVPVPVALPVMEEPKAQESPLGFDDLPDAPAVLTAPRPVGEQTVIGLSDFDADVKAFGNALGYYFTRKDQGAAPQEKIILLQQIKSMYTGKGIDMSLVDREIKFVSNELGQTIKPKPVVIETPKPVQPKVEPVAKPVPVVKPAVKKPAPKKVKKRVVRRKAKVQAADPEMERSWRFYQESVKRGISDHERIEMLESMLIRFGESAAEKINKELRRLQSRAR